MSVYDFSGRYSSNTWKQQENKSKLYCKYRKEVINIICKKKKKFGACVFLSTVFFLSLLAGKFATTEQMLLTEWTNKNDACVITAPVFF